MLTLEEARKWYPASDPVHGFDHIQRVYHLAERLALAAKADLEIVRAAALLHDAGDSLDTGPGAAGDNADNRLGHHHVSALFARQVLQAQGWSDERINAVEHCIRAHRFRDDREQPETIEAQVLFDADKLDAIGATGVARAVAYAARAGQPAYFPPSDSFLQNGQMEAGEAHSAYHEFLFKLRKLQDRLYTPAARQIAAERHAFMESFFIRLASEAQGAS
jgi:uncharacterized protein